MSAAESEDGGGPVSVRVVVCASDPLVAYGASSMLAGDGRVRLLAEEEADQAEVIVVVEERVDEKVLGVVRKMRARSGAESPPRCVLVTDQLVSELLISAIESGMAAILHRSSVGGEDVVRTVLAVNDGAAYLPPRFQGRLLAHLDRISRDMLEPHGFTLSGLSAKERDVLRLLAEGYNTDEIGQQLAYSASTVKSVLYALMKRHGLTTRAHAVAFAMRTGAI